jgi:hypothetical protein
MCFADNSFLWPLKVFIVFAIDNRPSTIIEPKMGPAQIGQ